MREDFVFYNGHNGTRIQTQRRRSGQDKLRFERVLVLLGPYEVAIVGDAVKIGYEGLHGRLKQNKAQLVRLDRARTNTVVSYLHYDAAVVE